MLILERNLVFYNNFHHKKLVILCFSLNLLQIEEIVRKIIGEEIPDIVNKAVDDRMNKIIDEKIPEIINKALQPFAVTKAVS